MVEIYNYDITTHEKFAKDQQDIEAFRKQFHVTPSSAGIIAIQTKILDLVPKHPAIDLLTQTYQRKSWARFVIPKNYYLQRFASSYIAPSIGPQEKLDADILKLETFINKKTRGRYIRRKKRRENREQEETERQNLKKDEEEFMDEGEKLIALMEKGIKETNLMVDFVIARIHQFVQA